MLLTTLFSTACLFANPMISERSIDIIQQHHLETPEGKIAFLTGKLTAYAETAGRLNQEILGISEEIQALSPEEDQEEILFLAEEMTEKMATLGKMLPFLLTTDITIEEDLQELDVILGGRDPLSPEQQQVLDRIASLCDAVDSL